MLSFFYGVLTGKQLEKEAALRTAVTGNYFIIKDADDRFIDFVLNLSPIISLIKTFSTGNLLENATC